MSDDRYSETTQVMSAERVEDEYVASVVAARDEDSLTDPASTRRHVHMALRGMRVA